MVEEIPKTKPTHKSDPNNDLGVIWNADHTKILIDHRSGKDKKSDE